MKRHNTQHSSIGLIGTAVVTATLIGCTTIPHTALAAPIPAIGTSGVYVSILRPTVDVTDPAKQIEVSAFYEAAPATGGITTLELYIDGQQEAVKKLDSPENKGVVSFVIGPGTLNPGSHHIVVRVSAGDAEIASANTVLDIAQPATDDATIAPALGGDTDDGSAPAVAIMDPLPDTTVVGTVDIKVDAHDKSGKSPYVSLFIDHNFKTLRNFPPYDFAWDTTRVANGYHTLEVWGYNDDQTVGHGSPITVYVNNPSGRTMVRHDLLDTVPATLVSHPAFKAAVAAVAAAPKVTPVKPTYVLAKGERASVSQPARLAVATFDGSGSMMSEQAQLMSPFLPAEAPQIKTPVTEPRPEATSPALAGQTVQTEQSAAKIIGTSFSTPKAQLCGFSELASPSIETSAPVRPEAVRSEPVKTAHVESPSVANQQVTLQSVSYQTVSETPASVASSSVIEAPDVQQAVIATSPAVVHAATVAPAVAQVKPAPDLAQSGPQPYAMRLAAMSSNTVVDDQSEPALESPTPHLDEIKLKASLAAGAPVANLRSGAAKIASASIDTSSLMSTGSALQAPDVAVKHISAVVSEHTVQTKLMALGGFTANDILRTDRGNQLVMNNRLVALTQPMQDRNSFLFAPFRQIFETEGGVMAWNAASHQVHALSSTRDIELTIGSRTATVNQQPITLNASPYLTNGHTMIPLAFVPIALDASVSYDPISGHLIIDSKE